MVFDMGIVRSISGSSERVHLHRHRGALGGGVGGLSELHRQRRGLVVVDDGDHRLCGLSRGCGDAARERAEGEFDLLAVVVHRVVRGRERDGLLGVRHSEDEGAGDPAVVVVGRPGMVGRGYEYDGLAAWGLAQLHLHRHGCPFVHRVGGALEVDGGRCRQVLPLGPVVNGDGGLLGCGQPRRRPEAFPKESLTRSPDSERLSSTAETSKDLEVSPASKVTFSGTPE